MELAAVQNRAGNTRKAHSNKMVNQKMVNNNGYQKWLSKVVSAKQIEGRPYGVVDLENHILVLLIYYRCYITQEFIGMLYGTADSSICRTIQRIEPILASVVAIKKDRTLSKKELETIIMDCTEQPIERPIRKQKKYYSGKKKRHTMKTQVQISENSGDRKL